MHVAREVAAQGPAGGVVEVRGAEAAVPEVCGGVFVGDEEDGEGAAAAVVVGGVGGVGGWDDGVGGAGWGVVFAGVGGEGFGEGCSVGPAAGAGGGIQFLFLVLDGLVGWEICFGGEVGRVGQAGYCVYMCMRVKGGGGRGDRYMSSVCSDSRV